MRFQNRCVSLQFEIRGSSEISNSKFAMVTPCVRKLHRVNGEFKIDLGTVFPTLRNAPIVEAALDIQARAGKVWDAFCVAQQLKTLLPDYPTLDSHNRVVQRVKLHAVGGPETTSQDLGLIGFRVRTDAKPHIAQFNRDGFQFSRLSPYESWEGFISEAFRLWKIYIEVAKPTEVQRISLRYINRIDLPPGDTRFEDYIQPAPQPPLNTGLPFYGFFHQDMLAVPGHDYSINIVRTVQPPQDPVSQGIGLIIDIAVSTLRPFVLVPDSLEKRLPEMRWLKNLAFYGSITQKSVDCFKC